MKKSLPETNPYLKDPAQRKRLLRRSLVSSFAIEGIYLREEPVDSVKKDAPGFTVRTLAKVSTIASPPSIQTLIRRNCRLTFSMSK